MPTAVKYSLLALCLFVGPAFGAAAPSNLIVNISGRTTISLNGTWNIIVDPYDSGFSSRFWENRKPRDKQDLVEYDFDKSETLKVPGDWNSQRDRLFFYEGTVWYERSFLYHKREHTRTFVYFGAANYQTTVYLNGQRLGEHTGGFTPFDFEVTDKIQDGDNFIVAAVNDTRRVDGVPALSTDFWNYGGLTRDVSLVEVPDVFVQDYFVQLAKSSAGEVAGWVKLNGTTTPQQVSIEIPEAGVKQTVTTDSNGYAEFHFPAKVGLWSPDHPKLYQVVLSLSADKVQDQIGFRTIEVRGTSILLNGKPIFLRGISLHEEAPFGGGRAFSTEDDRILLGWAQELGCNYVRLAHYPHNEAMIRLADQLGLLVWEEIPVYWGIDWQDPGTLENAEGQLRESITRDHNRAAVILWSIGNETPNVPARLEFLKKLSAEVRELDGTRLITAAMNTAVREGLDTRLLNDALGATVDVLGVNEYIGWYEGRPEDADHTQWKTIYDKPMVMSEFGAGALYGSHGDADERWTEEYQANLYEHQIQMLKRVSFLAGMSPWVLMDFHSPRRVLPGIQDYYNRKGLISERGERKKAFYVLQNFYRTMKDTSGSDRDDQ
ncbi:MAG: glycoside hydrolase family 2 protein [Candidatus Acidiferrales bacterium]